MARLFGTDGVRGLANRDLTPELALSIATAAVRELVARSDGHRPTVIIGRDPRASGEMLEAAVIAGATSAGADVLLTGVVPTPAVAFLVAETGADCGVVLSASHNAMPDNGVKLFGPGGHKLPDAVEDAIEKHVDTPYVDRPVGIEVGRLHVFDDAAERYTAHLLAACPTPLRGLRVVVDCAHGSASTLAPVAYAEAGADVTAIGAEPDGLNINAGYGSTHPERLRAAVLEHGADIGIAHDGDADRALAVDATGALVDGDQIMGILATAMADAGTLRERTLVATVMSNLGLHLAMRERDIAVRTTPVGDRYVLEELLRDDLSLGGEQSGHLVLRDHATTGDGLLTALSLFGCMVRSGRSLAELASVVQRLPQVLVNVTVADKARVAESAEVAGEVERAAARLGDTGRVLLRPSGTEPLVRVMVEAPTHDEADDVARRIADVVGAAS